MRHAVNHHINRLISWIYIRRIWGKRHNDYDETCAVCAKWREHDEIFGGADEWTV
jgi:hypothetical protein